MGKEIQVNSLEGMCDLMCDNKLPDGQKECKERKNEERRTIKSNRLD